MLRHLKNKIKRVFGTDEVSENSTLEKLLFTKISLCIYRRTSLSLFLSFIESFLLLFFKKEEKILTPTNLSILSVADCSGIGEDVADVGDACEVHNDTLKAEAVACVLSTAEATEVAIPPIILFVEVALSHS